MAVLTDAVTVRIAFALAEKLEQLIAGVDELDELQVSPFRISNPSPPSIDVYAADPSQDDAAFGPTSRQTVWTVRARCATADTEGQQLVLLALAAPSGPTSVRSALMDDQTLDDTADGVQVEGPTGLRLYQDLNELEPLMGIEWRVVVFTPTGAET